MNMLRVVLIEEDETSREVFQLMLEDKFELDIIEDLDLADKYLCENDIDIVILDMSGKYEKALSLCHSLNNSSENSTEEGPVVIALGSETNDVSIKNIFQAGVHDYFIKPYNIVLFNESLMRLANSMRAYSRLKESDKAAKGAFEVALGQASYYGFALELIANINAVSTIEGLAGSVLNQIANKGICCAVQFRTSDGIFTYEEDRDEAGERTLEVFDLLSERGRIYRFGKRLIFNDQHVSILVKSMDDSRQTIYDSVLDIGAKIVPAIEARFEAIQRNQVLADNQQQLKLIISKLNEALSGQIAKNNTIVQHIARQISASFDVLEMTEDQERFFINLVETELNEESDGNAMVELESMITQVLTSCEEVIQEEIEEQKQPAQENFSDVELF